MKKYQIENTTTGLILGIYKASSEGEALEKMAKDAGYTSYSEASKVANGNDIRVSEIK